MLFECTNYLLCNTFAKCNVYFRKNRLNCKRQFHAVILKKEDTRTPLVQNCRALISDLSDNNKNRSFLLYCHMFSVPKFLQFPYSTSVFKTGRERKPRGCCLLCYRLYFVSCIKTFIFGQKRVCSHGTERSDISLKGTPYC